MAEQDDYKDQYNDEYQFSDLDAISPDDLEEESTVEETTVTKRRNLEGTNIRRNALIVVVLVILVMVLYKFLGSYFSSRKIAVETPTPTPKPTLTATPKPTPQPVRPTTPPAPQTTQTVTTTTTAEIPKVEQKLSALELSQQNMRSEVASVNSQLGGINSSVNTLSTQIAELNKVIAALSAKIDEQAQDIEKLMIKTKPKKIKHIVRKITIMPKYYIQAVIPGRAWLIAQNGATLTVREGTVIPGYGTVKLIDPIQGRINTSSGQIIRFSQDDS